MNSRAAEVSRKTSETDIVLSLNLDGSGICAVENPVGFFAHMLASFCKHGLFDLSGSLSGDLHVDQHHLIEDTGIVLGQLFDKALGDRAGIYRAGFFIYPMDDTLARAAVDFGGRPYLSFDAQLSSVPLVSGGKDSASFQTDTVHDFWQGFVQGARCNMHIDVLRGRSDHHKIEAVFKAAARAIREAVSVDSRSIGVIPSTKGTVTF
ncbi:MAG: imidazoleglycerol-phosphate dehydratase [Treponema sp.]|nr:MAG: Imidazoleglycerol-phosphate dehydratase [Spirochaetes bacterium ADurb.Bin269]TAH50455.1 MAG: imidazoleglycerol-phosphate dehydratase [Treponema sp.]